MSESGGMEKYCSAYYDKHGLYNDGFPCPADKYCCQTSDGTKMCCSISANDKVSTKSPLATSYFTNPTSSKSHMLNTLSNFKASTKPQQQQQKPFDLLQSSVSITSPFLLTNSTVVFTSVCIGLAFVAIFLFLLLICVCRCCCCQKRKSTKSQKLKMVKTNNSNNNVYSRNSSSSCATSSGSSSASTSPKTNEITVSCEEDEHEKILSIDPSHHTNNRAMNHSNNTNNNENLIIANHHFNDIFAQRNLNIYTQGNFISSGSSACASTALLLNNTAQSFGNAQINLENSPNYLSEMGFDEHEENENDFIVTTSSNLEFLKTHSLFNQTPLNYYPTLNMANGIKVNLEEPPSYTETQVVLTQTVNPTSPTSTIQTTSTNNNNSDYRFSTFLPPIYMKHHEL